MDLRPSFSPSKSSFRLLTFSSKIHRERQRIQILSDVQADQNHKDRRVCVMLQVSLRFCVYTFLAKSDTARDFYAKAVLLNLM